MKKTTIRPLPGFVLIEPIEDEDKTTGGLYLPEASKDKPSKGKIINAGPRPLEEVKIYKDLFGEIAMPQNELLKKGTIVVFKKWTNQEVSHEGKEYLLVAFSELLAVIE